MLLPIFFAIFLISSSLVSPLPCPDGFVLINQHICLNFFLNSQDHLSASEVCTSYGGTLVTVKNAIDNRGMTTLAADIGLPGIWIGIMCYLRKDVVCFNDDGSGVITYNNFAPGYPKENSAIGQCVVLRASGASAGKWETNDCRNETLPFACEVPMTVDDGGKCKYNYNGFCYLPSHETFDTHTSTFEDARKICAYANSYLASIHSKGEIDFVTSIYRGTGIDNVFLGAQARQPHVFNWIDGSSWDYTYLNPFDNSTENCMQMDVTRDKLTNNQILGGTWSEQSCEVAQNFLCKRRIVGSTSYSSAVQTHNPYFDLSDPSNCNNTLLIAPGTIASIGYGSSPLPGGYCSWRMATTGAYRVMLHFTDFSVYYNVDVMDQWGENVARLSDNRQPFSLLVESSIATITHLADKDSTMGRHGFRAVVMPY